MLFYVQIAVGLVFGGQRGQGHPEPVCLRRQGLPAIEVATSTTREAQWIRESFHIDPTDKQAFQQWLAGKRVFMDKKGTNMHMLWAMIVRKTYGHRMRAIPSVRESV